MKPYNGHRSWNAWNVALWINNDEPMYRWALRELQVTGNNPARAAHSMMRKLEGERTPDGAKYNFLCVREALAGLLE
jgi:hypothetical protein